MPFFMNIWFVFTGDRKPNYGHFFHVFKITFLQPAYNRRRHAKYQHCFLHRDKNKTPFGGCRRSTRQQPVALRFRIWYQETKCWSIATAIPDSSDPRINFAMRQNRPDPRRRRVMKEEVRTTSARPALKWFAIAGTIRPKLFLKIKK